MAQTILTDVMGTTTPNSHIGELLADFKEHGERVLSSGYLTNSENNITVEVGNPPREREISLLSYLRRDTGKRIMPEIVAEIARMIGNKNLDKHYMGVLGVVNRDGYYHGRLDAGFFVDVEPVFDRWKLEEGRNIYVYSSGSAFSQNAMFTHSKEGKLRRFIDGFFDLKNPGSKYEAESYEDIAMQINVDTSDILFLSDSSKELDAAHQAGCDVKLVVRPGNKETESDKYQVIHSFSEI
jgi:enolase-phosphatase E1